LLVAGCQLCVDLRERLKKLQKARAERYFDSQGKGLNIYLNGFDKLDEVVLIVLLSNEVKEIFRGIFVEVGLVLQRGQTHREVAFWIRIVVNPEILDSNLDGLFILVLDVDEINISGCDVSNFNWGQLRLMVLHQRDADPFENHLEVKVDLNFLNNLVLKRAALEDDLSRLLLSRDKTL